LKWICVGYVKCAGYVWDMCGVRYANNLLKNPATKRLSGKKISFPSGLRSRQQYLWPKSSGSRAVGPHLAECNTQITQTSKLEIDDSTLRSEPRLQRSWLTARHWQLLQPRLGSSHTSVYLSHVSVISIMYKFLHWNILVFTTPSLARICRVSLVRETLPWQIDCFAPNLRRNVLQRYPWLAVKASQRNEPHKASHCVTEQRRFSIPYHPSDS